MTWTAPEIARTRTTPLGDERTILESWLEFHRRTLLRKCGGLSAEQLRRRAVEPSTLSLLGLVRHMAKVERLWFRNRFLGEDVPLLFSSLDNPDGEFDDVDSADAEADFATFEAEVAYARGVAAGRSLDETFELAPRGTMSLRWIYVHMIEEYARHNGHADLLRERIDGVTGD